MAKAGPLALVVLTVGGVLPSLAANPSEAMVVADRGTTTCAIVVGHDASAPEQFAAEELQTYLARMCGTTLAIRTANDDVAGSMIVIGTPQSNRLVGRLGGPVTFSEREKDYDAFVVRTLKDCLILAGANPRSCLHAVYDFLENDLGVFWPSVFDQEEAVPKRNSVHLEEIDRRAAASFKYRGYTGASSPRTLDLMAKWKMNFTGVPYGQCDDEPFWAEFLPELQKRGIKTYSSHHGFHDFLPPEVHFDGHPEYYALRPVKSKDGGTVMQREPRQFCTHHPEALKIYTDGCLDFMGRHPEVDIFCPGPEDGYGWCMCPLCGGDRRWQVRKEVQFGSDRLMHAVNSVARRAADEAPGKPVLYFGYVATGEVPKTEKPLPNVTAMLAFFEHSASDLTASARYRNCEDIRAYYRNNVEQWTALVPEVTIYEYYCGRSAWNCRPFVRTTNMKHSLQFLAQQGVKGLIVQCPYNWWRAYLTNHYLLGKLLWNVNTDTDAALADFCRRRYGPAGQAMFDYFNRMDSDDVDMAKCQDDLNRAERRVDSAEAAKLVRHQQTLFGWRQMYDRIAECYRNAVELVKAGRRGEAETLYDKILELERETQRYADQTGLQTVIDRPAGFFIYSDILRTKYRLGTTEEQAGRAEGKRRSRPDLDSGHRRSARGPATAAQPVIAVTSNPPLPVANLVRNGGFEQGGEFPAGQGAGRSAPGWRAHQNEEGGGVTDEQARSGRYGYKLVGNKTLRKNIRQRQVGRLVLDEPLAKGTRLLCSAWSKSTGADPGGGHYGLSTEACGRYLGGPKFAKAAGDWQYAEHAITLPEDASTIASLYVTYYEQSGAAYFDDVFLGVGATELSLRVELPRLERVTVLNDRGEQVFDSGALPAGTGTFEKTVQVPTRRTYTVRAEDAGGNLHVRQYPVRGNKLDLAGLYKRGKVSVQTNMTGSNPSFPAMGPSAVFDGDTGYGSGTYQRESEEDVARFVLGLDRPYRICRIGLCLKRGSPTSAELSVMSDGRWKPIRRYWHAITDGTDMVYLQPSETITAVKLDITDCPGLKVLTELQLFEDPGVGFHP